MAYEDITALLGGWEGFELVGVQREPGPRIVLELRPVSTAAKQCSRCGATVSEIHETTQRRVRDLPILDAETWLVFPRARLECPRCGPTVEAVPWLDRYQRMTTRLAEAIARLAQVLPIKHVAQWFRLGWATVKQIDKRSLAARLGPVDLSTVRVIAVDEFAIQRGHRYATIVAEPATRRVLWIGRGRGREDLRWFFLLLGAEGCARLEAVVADMSPAYTEEIRLHCPQAAIVYDLFHVVAKYGREVIDRVRVDKTNRIARAAGHNDPETRAPSRHQRHPLALASEPREPHGPPRSRALARAAASEPRPIHRVRAQGRSQSALALSLSRGSAPVLAAVVPARPRQSSHPARDLCPTARGPDRGRHQPLSLPPSYGPARRDEQQDQSARADGLRFSRRRLLLPENPRRVSRNSVKNQKKAAAYFAKESR